MGASDIAATRTVPAMRRVGHEVTAVLSGSASWAREYADRLGGAAGLDDTGAFLARDDVDAVYVSSTNDRHLPQVLAAAAAGRHVLCEKPLALTLDECAAMTAACARAGVVLAVNHHLPAAGTHRAIRDLVAGGAIGRPLAVAVTHATLLPERLRDWRLGDAGSIRAVGVLTPEPEGTVWLTDAAGTREHEVPDRRHPYDITLEAFTDAVHGRGRPVADGVDGARALAVALAVLESARTGTRVPVAAVAG